MDPAPLEESTEQIQPPRGKPRMYLFLIVSFILVICTMAFIFFLTPEENYEYTSNSVVAQREQITIDELILTGDEEITYNNKDLLVRGNIRLLDNSKLTVKNSKFTIDIEYNRQYTLEAANNSTLIIENCEYESLEWRWYNFEYRDDATVRITDFAQESGPWQSISHTVDAKFDNAVAGMTFAAFNDEEFKGSVEIRNSDSVYFELNLKPGETYDLTLPNGYVEEWHPDYYVGTIDVYDSTITNLDIDLFAGVDVTVRDSTNFALGWIFGEAWGGVLSEGTSGEISGLRKGYYDDQTFSTNNASLRLINTDFDEWWPIVTGDFELTVRDSDMMDPWAYADSTFNVYDSFIFYMSATNDSTVNIYNSIVEDSLVVLENATVNLYDTEFDGEINAEEGATVTIDGEVQ